MTVGVKICGLNSMQAAEAALAAKADFGGLVFFPKSPRHVSLEAARTLAALLRGKGRVVALLVDPNDEEVAAVASAIAADLIQLHGRRARKRSPLPSAPPEVLRIRKRRSARHERGKTQFAPHRPR